MFHFILLSTVIYMVSSLSTFSAGHLRLLGSKCSSDQECLADVTYSRCQAGRCSCLPYYAEYNKTMCVQSTLLGFSCLVKEQCSMKVANSKCLRGTCRCESGFLQFRRHTCLSPASPGDVCYSDAHCRLWDGDTHCDFLIPNLFGRCQCNPPKKQRGNKCALNDFPTADEESSASGPSSLDSPNTSFSSSAWGSSASWQPVTTTRLSTTSSTTSTTRPTTTPETTTTSPTTTPETKATTTPVPATTQTDVPQPATTIKTTVFSLLFTPPSEIITNNPTILAETSSSTSEYVTETFAPEVNTEVVSTTSSTESVEMANLQVSSELYPFIPLLTEAEEQTTEEPTTTAEDLSTEAVVLNTSAHNVSVFTTEAAISSTATWSRVRGVGERASVTLGLSCVSDLQCQSADPGSRCLNGVCDCVIKDNGRLSCGSTNTGCFKGTFQCRSSGVCISWFFVCDGRQDCQDGSDEECQNTNECPPHAFKCGKHGGCVSRAGRCDGTADCPGGEDELNCNATRNIRGCPERTFRCSDGRCLPEYEFCNAMVSCPDGSDEPRDACKARNKNRTSRFCPFRCANGRCRSDAIACSGRDGCGDGSDESHCSVCKCPPPPREGEQRIVSPRA